MNSGALIRYSLILTFLLLEVKAEPAEVEKKPEVEVESVEPTGRGSSGVFMSHYPEWFWQCYRSGSG
jgi:hypothetical protein